jgi:DNA primase
VAFPPAFLDELRTRVGLVQVVSRRVKLHKAGREWKGCCPFHNEKTPSFYVNEEKQFYHCFGCGAHGDVIRFVVEQEGLRFPDAVRSLAAEAGLEVPEESPEAREREREKAGLHDVMAEAARWFAAQLDGLSGANARRYVGERGLAAETVERFGLGFAPDGNKLKSALKSHGEDKLLECGLIGRAEDRGRRVGPAATDGRDGQGSIDPEVDGRPARAAAETYDRFRGRLMFPIRDPRGRVVGFGGRILGDGQPKYLNSPDTALFDKGRLLYNLDQAGPVARKSARLFVVEGYLDVIALSQAGIAEAVAPLGTALTEQQLQLLWRIVPEPILCFDGDKAGLAAAGRAARRALPLLRPGCSLRILTLPQGQDPDDIIRQHGSEHFLKLAEGAEPLHAFLWRSLLESTDASTPERRAGLRQELRELANTIADTEIKALYQNQFRESFNTQFEWRPTARQPYVAAAPQPAQPKMRRPSQAKYAMLEVICGWLLYPEIVAADLEQAASLPLYRDLRRLIPLRQAILDAVAWDPTIGPAELRHTLVQRGHTEVVDGLWNALRLHLPFTFEALEPERARPMLAKLSWGLIELVENQEAIDAETAALKATDGDEAEEHARRQRELVLRRDEIHRELADFALETGAFAANKVRLQAGNDSTPSAPSEASPADDESLPAQHVAAG